MTKALLPDRDGVVNEDDGYTYKSEDFRLTNGIFEFSMLCKNLAI